MDDLQDAVLRTNNAFGVQSLFQRNLLARVAIYYCFMLEGEFAGVWGRYIPEIQDKINLSDSLLGTSVTFYYLGNVLAAPLVAYLVKRFGSRFTTTSGAWMFIAAMPLVGLAGNFAVLTLATFAFGLSCGIMDISMNSSAILTEIVANIPLLGSFHGSYSIAAALGSLIGGVFVQSGLSTFSAFAICSAIGIVLSLGTFFNMYDHEQELFLMTHHKGDGADPEAPEGVTSTAMDTPLLDPSSGKSEHVAISNESWKILAVFASIGFFGSFGESSIVTWSTVYFDRDIHANSVVKSLGLTCFMVCMGIGRFLCDYLRRRIGRRVVMRTGGLLAMSGLILVVLSIDLPCPVAFACIGFSCTGLGLSTIVPTCFSSAGHLPGVHGGTAVAIVAGCTYTGSIISPPLIGLLSDAFGSLRMALLCDGLLLGMIIPISFKVLPEAMVFQDGEVDHGYGGTATDEPDDGERVSR